MNIQEIKNEQLSEENRIINGCGKKMRNPENWRVQEYYSCGETVQTGWDSGYQALCKSCRLKLKDLKNGK